MILLLVVLTAVVYGLLMKYVLTNTFVSKSKTAVTASEGKTAGEQSSDLIPVYER
ncbi:hypothetical protein [Bacillus salacetis]|uniref:hypothetical protein n=1 Tax=Bacillus salacetis TaxID=2315464 RepID=UPI001443BB41|nr:hypothetical protein [Bacillus salacetis]